MPRRSPDLHGNAPHESRQALLLIDTINDLEWEGAAPLRTRALAAAQAIARLKQRARAAGVPVIYVNDNYGQWRSNFQTQIEHCLASRHGRAITELLRPTAEDYFILKAKHSGFFASPLHLLLEHIKARELILTGFTTESCVYFTAADAYVRDYQITVPNDCVASYDLPNHKRALELMQHSVSARILPSSRIRFQP